MMPPLNWIGKEKVVNHHLDVPFRTLEKKYTYASDGQDDGGNMIIHGDNLDAVFNNRGYAGLTGVQVFPKHNALCGKPDICSHIHNTGTFAAKFQNGRRHMLGSMVEHLFADRLTAGKEHKIKSLFEQSSIFCSAACDNRHIFWAEAFRYNFFNDFTCGGRIGARLQNSGISCSDGIGKRSDGQKKRIGPWTHDQRVAVGHGLLLYR